MMVVKANKILKDDRFKGRGMKFMGQHVTPNQVDINKI